MPESINAPLPSDNPTPADMLNHDTPPPDCRREFGLSK